MSHIAKTSMRRIVEEELRPIMISLFRRIQEGGPELVIDGMPAYNERAQFVGGKVINQACYTALELLKTQESLNQLGQMISMVSHMPMETWGILNGISGLYRLKKAGLLERTVDPETLETLKRSMDWRTFVDIDNDYSLIHKPTNYYGVAFGIARHRELMGWDEQGHSRRLLDRLLEHIHRYSGAFCFMDETRGEGRFDRYSILVPSELASQLLATGWEVPEKIRDMLKKSAGIFLKLSDEKGQGFSYGRSIGAYGDTAALEVLSAAARLDGVMTENEKEIAYGYSVLLIRHMIDFWYDRDMESINMWEKGRKTDNYRNKYRILGENLSLCMQMVNSFEHWDRAGYGDRKPCEDYRERIAGLDRYTYVPFAEGRFARGLAIARDGSHVWSLPLISGGQKYYDKDPYMPVPYENLVLQGGPEYSHGQLVPQLFMENGDVLMPIVYMKEITPKIEADRMAVTCHVDAMCLMGGGIFISGETRPDDSLADNSVADDGGKAQQPRRVEGISDMVTYVFGKNQIRREDVFTVAGNLRVKKIRLVLLTYSHEPETEKNLVRFDRGAIACMRAEGYGGCSWREASDDGSHDTPHGRLGGEVIWETDLLSPTKTLEVSWIIEYRQGEKDTL